MDQGSGTTWDRHRVSRLARMAALVSLVFLALRLGPPWFLAFIPHSMRRRIIVRLLVAAQVSYGIVLTAVPVAAIVLIVALLRSRRRGARGTWFARGFVLCVAVIVASVMAEGVAAAWLAWRQTSTPRLPTRFPDPPTKRVDGNGKDGRAAEPLPTRFADTPDDETLDIVEVGGSSACGCPYDEWLSVGRIVAWKLQAAIPNRRFRVEQMAHLGYTLELAHNLMSGLKRRPELVIVYAGHNEFDGRYNWEHTPLHYVDDTPPARVKLERSARQLSPLCRLIQRTIETYRVSLPPPHHTTRPFVDVPVYTVAEYAARLREFGARLETIVSYCERLARWWCCWPLRRTMPISSRIGRSSRRRPRGRNGRSLPETSRPRGRSRRSTRSRESPTIGPYWIASRGSPKPTTGWLACSKRRASGMRRTSTTCCARSRRLPGALPVGLPERLSRSRGATSPVDPGRCAGSASEAEPARHSRGRVHRRRPPPVAHRIRGTVPDDPSGTLRAAGVRLASVVPGAGRDRVRLRRTRRNEPGEMAGGLQVYRDVL